MSPSEFYEAALEALEWMEKNPIKKEVLFHYQGEVTKEIEEVDRPFTYAGLCLRMGISYPYFDRYRKLPQYEEIFHWLEEVMYSQKFERAAVGIYNGNLIGRDLGLADKQEVAGSVVVNLNGNDAEL